MECQCSATTTECPKPLCRRCGSTHPYIILDRVHVECRDCFLESCNKKIRSTIGRAKLVRNNDSILIAHSGGPSSSALAALIKNSIDSEGRREQKFRPSLLHVDMQSILHQSYWVDKFKSERCEGLLPLLNQLRKQFPSWPLYWTSIEMAAVPQDSTCNLYARHLDTDGSDLLSSNLLSDNNAHRAFQQSLQDLRSLTDQTQYVADSCRALISKVAHSINLSFGDDQDQFKFVFTGSTATQLANDLMVDVILGRGSAIRSTVDVCDNRSQVPIMRPLRDFSKKEIAFYLKANAIQSKTEPNLSTRTGPKSSVQTLTESFLTKLYLDYPSTYSTLLRTGNKMS